MVAKDIPLHPRQVNASVGFFLDKLIDQLLEKEKITEAQAEHLKSEEIHPKLIEEISLSLKKENELTLSDLENPEFLEKLLLVCTTAIMLEKNFSTAKLSGLDRLRELQEKVNQYDEKMKKENPDFKLKPSDLEKILTSEELQALQTALKQTRADTKEFIKTPRPEPTATKQDEPQPDVVVVSLLGLIANQTGTLAAVVTYNPGNFNSIVDMNPNDGTSFIAGQNSINDTFYGDSQGFNARTMQNFLAQGDPLENVLDTLQHKLKNMELTPFSTTPKPPGSF